MAAAAPSRTRRRTGPNTAGARRRKPQASRPYMPGYGLPQGTRGLLPWKWAVDRLTKSHNYWLLTTLPDGAPHAMPIWGIWVSGAFYFSTGRESRKAKNLARDPHCVVCNERAEEAVIMHGEAAEVTDAALIRRLGKTYYAKYKWKLDPAMGPVYAVRPRVAFGMAEDRFVNGATRWTF